MNRVNCMMVCCIACLLVAGCRRGSSGSPRDPVKVVREKDLLTGKKDIDFESRPLSRRYRLYVVDLGQENLKDQNWREVADSQEKAEQNKDLKESMRKKEEAQNDIDAGRDMAVLGPICAQYIEDNNPTLYRDDLFYQFARRSGKMAVHKYLDKSDWTLFAHEIPVFKFLASKKMTFVTEADKRLANCIVGYHDGADGNWVFRINCAKQKQLEKTTKGTVVNGILMPFGTLAKGLRDQELEVLRLYFLAYVAPNYLKFPERDLGNFVSANPTGFLAARQQQEQRDMVRVSSLHMPPLPADRDLGRFVEYLKQNAPPRLVEQVANKVLAVNLLANPREALAPVACHTEVEKQAPPSREAIGHSTVFMSAAPAYRLTPMVEFFLPPPEKKK